MKHLLISLCLAGPAMAQTCPEAPDHSEALAALIEETRAAPDQASGLDLSNQMWALWADAPDAQAQEMLDTAMARREAFDFDGAMTAANALIDYCPDYAEGYNQRAFVNFLRNDYDAALPDLEKTLELNDQHVAALTGQALTLMALERPGEAALILRRALKLNPWLGERSLLPVLEAQEDAL
ncbi:tetratricopeptide repeat protein [Roseovarius sp. 2305UL8-3]|uniref:tetratricopeptide repeat protein n=1 Tax=Roseovarius conchicola TaxID=3121636 RepID=UPI00352779C3